MATHDEGEWLALGQAARFLGVAQSTIRRWSDQGRVLAFTTPGGHRRFRRSDLQAFLERSGPGGRAEGAPLVLLVDDDPHARGVVRAGLEREGYTVREAAGVEQALAAVAEAKPDLVLLDVMMRIDGWDLLRRLQQQAGAGAIPVVTFAGRLGAAQQLDLQLVVERAKRVAPV